MYHKNRIVGVGILCGFFCVLTALAKTETTVQTLPTEKPVTASAVSLKEIPLEMKKAKILTNHPEGSYSLVKNDKGLLTLVISDPQNFWSLSKYLVVNVD